MPSLSLSGEASLLDLRQQEMVQTRQFLSFMLGEELFAMAIDDIREIIEYAPLTEVPLMPSFLRGVINLRGAVVPVIDLSVRLGRPATTVSRRTCIVILELPQQQQNLLLGVMVDAVRAVLTVELDKIEPALQFGAHIRTDFIDGMININDRFVVSLDVGAVFSVEELSSLIGLAEQEVARRQN
ncbi:purine-binding chemotaxis protein CheW [Herbaspirillum sp. Sphag1AN]|uniref:chemotaxis protein CheW n=1 Tax=unclassified Herbaspirillum TaxID=2624150 RepID=UPI001614079D|nr:MULTISPECIES: chemotaxis protein CheW [unclassified Herbaspirillum]MBB3212854.1 purine-binding chemotaxis protein CheW [Herbaspirillum sp. Sphag1AN]MBB3246051.1 purine-binding chemotaxis protein CheW [Herbaspirillum sp. Sphag64]